MRKIIFRLCFSLIAIAAVGGFCHMTWAMMNAPKPNEDGCLPGNRPRHNVLLVDSSDPIAGRELGDVVKLMSEIVAETEVNERFSLLFIGDGVSGYLTEVVTFCKLGSGGVIYQERQLAALLEEPMAALRGLEKSVLARSPIIEAIEMLLNRRAIFDAEDVRLWVVSDFLFNSRVSIYPGSSRHWKPNPEELPEPPLPPQGRFHEVRLAMVQRVKFSHLQEQALPFFLAYFGQYSEESPKWELF